MFPHTHTRTHARTHARTHIKASAPWRSQSSNPVNVDDYDAELDCDDREMEVYDTDILTEFVLPHLANHLKTQVNGMRYLNDIVWELNISEDRVSLM